MAGMYKGHILSDTVDPIWQMREIDKLSQQSQAPQSYSSPAAGGGVSLGGMMPTGGGATAGGAGNQTLANLTSIADPWSSQRGQYQTQLSSLMKDPSSFLQSDLFKASTAAGLEGVNRSAAAGGMLKSGNRLQALMDYGQKNAPENFFRMADLLGGYAGAKNQNPGGGLSAYTNLQNADTSRFSAENSARIGQFNADTARQGNTQQAQYAQSQQDTAEQRWQAEQRQQQQQEQSRQQQQQWERDFQTIKYNNELAMRGY